MIQTAIGMMSGTSLDGVDLVLAKIGTDEVGTFQVRELAGKTYSYDNSIVKQIRDAMDPVACSPGLIASLNYELAAFFSTCVFAFCADFSIDLDTVDFIASHGQTIYHIRDEAEGFRPSSLQLGDGSVLASLTGRTVISDFRNADIAAGGEGAPLVPMADFLLFGKTGITIVKQNIGGIANCTLIPASGMESDVVAFDNGPGNMMIDEAMRSLFHQPFDQDGAMALKGGIIPELFEEVNNHPFFALRPPKSTGREAFGSRYVRKLLDKYSWCAKADIIATLTHVTAFQIAESYRRFLDPSQTIDKIILSGGGIHNLTLVRLIGEYYPSARIGTLEELGYDSDSYEALAFAILGYRTINHLPGNLTGATGASRAVILGSVSQAYPIRRQP